MISDELYKIIVKNKGHVPAPVHLNIIFADGSVETIQKNASVWKEGNDEYIIEKRPSKKIRSLEVLDPTLLDADLTNNSIYF